jgi:hypothetical protein
VLYLVKSEPVGKTWFGRYDSTAIDFQGCSLEVREGVPQAIAQAKRPVCIENNYFEVKVCVYVCVFVCVYASSKHRARDLASAAK